MPQELVLALVFRAVKEPFAKQWLWSVFDRIKNYDEFKKASITLGRIEFKAPSTYTNMTQDQASII